MTAAALAFAQPDTLPADTLKRELQAVIQHGESQRPRSLQRTIGPSGLGEPCALRLAYSLLDWPRTNDSSDPLPSIVGTGGHAMFAGYFESCGITLPDGRPRYLVEQRVTPRHDIPGNADLFDRATGTVIDWKFVGPTKLKEYARDIGTRYRVQSHTYGLGFENAGETVQHVAVVLVPRGGFLGGMHVWTEPYDRDIALGALDRKDQVLALVAALDVEHDPAKWAVIPRESGSGCRYCSWFLPGSTDRSVGCPGNLA